MHILFKIIFYYFMNIYYLSFLTFGHYFPRFVTELGKCLMYSDCKSNNRVQNHTRSHSKSELEIRMTD